jgi:integrase
MTSNPRVRRREVRTNVGHIWRQDKKGRTDTNESRRTPSSTSTTCTDSTSISSSSSSSSSSSRAGATGSTSDDEDDELWLIDRAYSRATIKIYKRGAKSFDEWMNDQKINEKKISFTSPEGTILWDAIDIQLARYIHWLMKNDEPYYKARDALFGVKHQYTAPRKAFRRANLSLSGWRKLAPPQQSKPMPWEVAVAIAKQLTLMGEIDKGIAILVAFDGMLRISELLSITTVDVTKSRPSNYQSTTTSDCDHKSSRDVTYIHLAKTKTGDNQCARICHTGVQQLIGLLLSNKKNGHRLFPWSTQTITRSYKAAMAQLGIPDIFVFHSLRHGGATSLFERTRDINLVKLEGRWASRDSARHYIQDSVIPKVISQLPSMINWGREARDPHKTLLRAAEQYAMKSPTATATAGEGNVNATAAA